VVAISGEPGVLIAALLTIPLVLIARLAAVAGPISILRLGQDFSKGAIPILTWGGLRGGISVALVLSLPPSAERELMLTACYAVVIFSIVIQGLTMERVARRFSDPTKS
jgi:CPA1 family monovalent cation:H+ antiporter